MKKLLCVILLLTNISLFAWETTTHRAIDLMSLENVPNLDYFVFNSGLTEETYEDEIFDSYDITYFKYIKNGETNGMSELNATFSDAKYQSLIEAGTMLEDAQWPHWDWIDGREDWLFGNIDKGHGRFMNHFYNYQGLVCKSLKCSTTDAISWAYDSGSNDYDYMDAMNYFVRGLSEATESERRKYQAKMFVSVGHMMHMLNDMNGGRIL